MNQVNIRVAVAFLCLFSIVLPTIALADVAPPEVYDDCESDWTTVYTGDRCRTAEFEHGQCVSTPCTEPDAGPEATCLVCEEAEPWDDGGRGCSIGGTRSVAAPVILVIFIGLFAFTLRSRH